MTKSDDARFALLEQRIEALEGARPGRKRRPILVSIDGVCGLDPTRDSKTCPDANLYRRNQGCQGTACLVRAAEYYQERRRIAKEAAAS
jgi:hypothetical protein